jgi:CRISPR/Cas system-associated exonuclease Cas4 (RecB family)
MAPFSTPFLKHVAQFLYRNYPENIEDICLIFPNRRSISFFYKYFSEIVDHPIWSPACYTISDFYLKYTSFKKANNLILLSNLFDVYSRITHSNEDFDHFYMWGNVLLSDFDDIDKYRVDAKKLFVNLAAIKNVDEMFSYLTPQQQEIIHRFWDNFLKSRQSKEIQSFSNIWNCLYDIYVAYRNQLSEQGIAYEGMLCSEVSQRFDKNDIEISFYKTGFVGLNALNECDRSLLNYFKRNENGLYFWDYNDIYIDDEIHEAGFFIRKNIKEFSSVLDKDIFTKNVPDEIEIISVPYNIVQAKMIEKIISTPDFSLESPESTAIVLSDESLLVPLLYALPPSIKDVNITMGYSVKLTNIYNLIKQIVALHSVGSQQDGYYYKNVLNVLHHPYFFKAKAEFVRKIEDYIIQNNKIFVRDAEIIYSDETLFSLIFKKTESVEDLLSNFQNLLNEISTLLYAPDEEENETVFELEKESISAVNSFFIQLQSMISSISFIITPELCYKLIIKGLDELKIPFEGEPLKGIQIMGLLETRALDFQRIIFLSANEEFLPRNQNFISYIPFSIRSAFGLPTVKHHDAMYSYYFNRLLGRSQKIWIMYASTSSNGSEMSRFLRQLIYDDNYNTVIKNLSFSLNTIGVAPIDIPKDESTLQKLSLLLNGNDSCISPTAISTYITCPLSFYFKYIAQIKPIDRVKDRIDPLSVGIVLHETVRELYAPFINKSVSSIDMPADIDNTILRIIRNKLYNNSSPNAGNHVPYEKIILAIVKRYIEIIIEYDKNFYPFTIIALEKTYHSSLKVNDSAVRIEGKIDRIDRIGDKIRIVDYKTGFVRSSVSSINILFDKKTNHKKEILQSIIYGWIYHNNNSESIVYPVLYSLREMTSKPVETIFSIGKNKDKLLNINDIKDQLEENLRNLFAEILNPEINFSPTNNIKNCSYCDYKNICQK